MAPQADSTAGGMAESTNDTSSSSSCVARRRRRIDDKLAVLHTFYYLALQCFWRRRGLGGHLNVRAREVTIHRPDHSLTEHGASNGRHWRVAFSLRSFEHTGAVFTDVTIDRLPADDK